MIISRVSSMYVCMYIALFCLPKQRTWFISFGQRYWKKLSLKDSCDEVGKVKWCVKLQQPFKDKMKILSTIWLHYVRGWFGERIRRTIMSPLLPSIHPSHLHRHAWPSTHQFTNLWKLVHTPSPWIFEHRRLPLRKMIISSALSLFLWQFGLQGCMPRNTNRSPPVAL